MNRPDGLFRPALGIALFASALATARAQSYGPNPQYLTIGAAEFLPVDASIGTDGYLYFNGACCSFAPLNLPEGALIDEVCLYAYDDGDGFVEVQVVAAKLAPGGESPRIILVDPFSRSDGSIGYTDVCTSPFLTTIRGRIDADGDGGLDAVAYYLSAFASIGSTGSYGLGGVRIAWRRQVSAPPDAPTFGDVPASDPAFQYVEALFASKITAGCGDAQYCPDASLTRRQMAVFLAKAMGLHWTDSAP